MSELAHSAIGVKARPRPRERRGVVSPRSYAQTALLGETAVCSHKELRPGGDILHPGDSSSTLERAIGLEPTTFSLGS